MLASARSDERVEETAEVLEFLETQRVHAMKKQTRRVAQCLVRSATVGGCAGPEAAVALPSPARRPTRQSLEIASASPHSASVHLRDHRWLWAPLALVFGCAAPQHAEKPAATAGTSTRVEETPKPTQLVPFHGEGGFTVLMPPKPYQSERTESTTDGPVYVRLAQVRDEMAKYLASVSDFPKGSLDRVQRRKLLDSLQQSTVRSMGGTLVSSHEVDVAGMPGREFTATDPQGSEVTARIFVGASRVYTLAGTYPQGNIPGSIRQFLDSFQPSTASTLGISGAGVSTDKGLTR